jgi:hypothetical protein
MANDKEAQGRKLGEVIRKAWDDEAFMQRLLADATPVLIEHGVQLPAGMQVKAVTNSDKLSHLVIPPKPASRLSAEDLDGIAAGGGGCQGGWNTQDTTPTQACTGWVRQPSGASRFE